jgi:hypothetical protein
MALIQNDRELESELEFEGMDFYPVNTSIGKTILDGETVLRVVKSEKIDRADEDTFVRIMGSDFHNGTITMQMRSRLLPDAPEHARGFIGIVFRVQPNNAEFESYYVRPTNGRHPDPIRRSHGSQYFAYPGYTFSYFREHGIAEFEAPCDIGLDEWITLKAEIRDGRAAFYVNHMEQPALVVAPLKHGAEDRGAVGLYVDMGTEGFFRNISINYED